MTLQRAHQPSLAHFVPAALFSGRQRELTSIWKQYEAAKNEHMRVVLLTGDIGIGKTRLLHEIATHAQQDGAIVLQGSATDAEGMPPYLPFLEALGQYIRVTPLEILREQTETVARPLANILPELSFRLGSPPEPYPFPPEQTRLRLYEAVGAFLETISASHALVLTLDDLHWADPASLDLLCHIARHQSQARLLIIGTYWEGELAGNAVLEQVVTRLAYRRILTTITIDPLSSAEIEALAANYLGGPLAPTVSQLLYRQSEGNPFFAEEIIRSWLEASQLVQENLQWCACASLECALPQSIIGSLRQRFIRLSRKVIDDLRIAAIIGRTFDLSLLATVEGQEYEAVEERLLQAERAKLVTSDLKGIYTFSHDKIREVLYAEVNISRRRRLHETIGRVLEAQYSQESTRSAYHIAELAFHITRGNDRTRSIMYAQLAAEMAMQSSAIEEAITYYHTALELLDPTDQRYGSLLLGLGDAALLVGLESEAEASYKAAMEWFMRHGESETAVRAVHGLGIAQWRRGNLEAVRTSLNNALRLLDDALTPLAIRIRIDLAVLLIVYLGQHSEGTTHAQHALKMARQLEDKSLEAGAIRAMAGNLHMQGSALGPALRMLEKALNLVEGGEDLSEETEYCLYLAGGYYWEAKVANAVKMCGRMIGLIKRSSDPHRLRNAYFLQALCLSSQGRWVEAEQAVEQMHLSEIDLHRSVTPALLPQMRGFLAYQRGDYSTAEYELQSVALNRGNGPAASMFYAGLLGVAQARQGKYEAASGYLAVLDTLLSELPAGTLLTAPILVCQALIACYLGDQKRIVDLYTILLNFRGQLYWFLVDRVLGMIATRCEDWEAASAHLATAEMTARREALLPELAHTLLALADLERMRATQESATQVQNYLEQAQALFVELNLPEEVVTLCNRITIPASEVHATFSFALPANLTRREAEVLQHVAGGKSNRQIAHALKLSERTVANHLSHIFSKTGSGNRVEAATFAMSHNIPGLAWLKDQ